MRILKIDIDKLLKSSNLYAINPSEYILLQLIFDRNIPLLREYGLSLNLRVGYDVLLSLEQRGLIKILESDYALRGDSLSIFNDKEEKVEDWIDEYRELFPVYHKGDKIGCISKMKDFIKLYKFDKETILRATKFYIEDRSKDNYVYLRQAHYFIFKDKTSDLSAYCERTKAGVYDKVDSTSKTKMV